MDIAALSMNMAKQNVQSSVGIAMISNSLDVSKQSGEALASMISAADMELSVNPSVGSNFDLTV